MRTLILLLLFAGTLAAQSPITFSGRHAGTGAAVTIDSVYVLSESGTKDTTLVGSMSLQMDWLTSAPSVAAVAEELQLGIPFPNGFDAGTQFDVRLDRRATLALDVCDMLGKRVASFERVFEAGTQRFLLDVPTLAPGVYVLRASDGRTVRARKLLKLSAQGTTDAPGRLVWMGTMLSAGEATRLISEIGKSHSAVAGVFTFIGYAAGFLPDTLSQVTPTAGRTYEFTFTPAPDSRKIRIGRFVHAGAGTVLSDGGTVTVARPGSPVDGLAIMVPSGSYPTATEFTVGYATIEGHDQYFQPISPLISIGNGKGYSNEVMELTIPVEIPAGHFAMAWLYNERTGEVEALPPLAQDAHSITVMTRHFATSSVSGMGKKAARRDPMANVVVTSLLESALTGQDVINTGFQPGRDDWEFVNHGSVIAPRGHCAGQSITAMWYYYEQRLQATPPRPALYGAYDRVNKTPEELWMDNREGYRFASVIQQELDFNGRLADLLWKGRDSSYHSLTWKAFGMAMLVTGCPQYVGLTRLKADGTPDGGHAIIAYKQSFTEGKLYVADPNYPGALRSIQYDRSKGYYTPYGTKQDADEADERAYQNIGFTAKTALIEWDKVTARWPEFLDKSIGENGAPQFPDYGIDHVVNATTREEIDPEETISTLADSIWFAPKGGFNLAAYTLEGKRAEVNAPTSWRIPLNPGTNTIGLYTLKDGEFVDFRWVDVKREGFGGGRLFLNKIKGFYTRTWLEGGQTKTETSERDVWLKNYAVSTFTWQSATNGVLAYDTSYTNGPIIITIRCRVTLDLQTNAVTGFTYDVHYKQGTDWEEIGHVTGLRLEHNPDRSDETRDSYYIKGADACSYIVTLTNTTRRLDREDEEVLTSFSCTDNSAIEILLLK